MRRTEPVDVPRDRWGRPHIDSTSYTRASTLAKALDDQSGLIRWSARMAALGMSRNPDLVALAATTQPTDTKALDDIAERAKERAGATSGRDTGTSIHAATEALDYEEDVSFFPGDLIRDARGYQAAIAGQGLDPVLAETFVLNAHVTSAGTFDRVVWEEQTNRYYVADIKTGTKADPKYVLRYQGLSWAMQLAIYAHGLPWDQQQLGWSDLSVDAPETDRGLVLYIPRGSGKCFPLWVDLAVGWEAAQLASKVHAIRKAKVQL